MLQYVYAPGMFLDVWDIGRMKNGPCGSRFLGCCAVAVSGNWERRLGSSVTFGHSESGTVIVVRMLINDSVGLKRTSEEMCRTLLIQESAFVYAKSWDRLSS